MEIKYPEAILCWPRRIGYDQPYYFHKRSANKYEIFLPIGKSKSKITLNISF